MRHSHPMRISPNTLRKLAEQAAHWPVSRSLREAADYIQALEHTLARSRQARIEAEQQVRSLEARLKIAQRANRHKGYPDDSGTLVMYGAPW